MLPETGARVSHKRGFSQLSAATVDRELGFVILKGHSYGGFIAAHVAQIIGEKYPKLMSKVYLVTFGSIYVPRLTNLDTAHTAHFMNVDDVALRCNNLKVPADFSSFVEDEVLLTSDAGGDLKKEEGTAYKDKETGVVWLRGNNTGTSVPTRSSWLFSGSKTEWKSHNDYRSALHNIRSFDKILAGVN
jgi:hypothetical protein